MRTLLLSLLTFLSLHIGLPCHAQVYQPGFRTIGTFEEEPPLRLDLNIWYPTVRQAKDINFPPWTISGAYNAKPAEGRFPLLVLSHGSTTDRFSHHDLAAWLAREGFVVVAPTHSWDCMGNMDDLFTWRQLERRALEAVYAINVALAQKDIGQCVDVHRIGFVGIGSGAATGLLLGGALPNCDQWFGYCARAGAADVYCSPWAVERMNGLCAQLPLRKSLADKRIRAVAAIAPGFGMLFDQESFRYFYPPLLLVGAGRDQFNRFGLHCGPLGRSLGSKARFLDLPEADAGALMAPCPPALQTELPEMCGSVTEEEKNRIQKELRAALLAFFSHYLVITGNLPVIGEPPQLEQGESVEKPLAPVKKRGKR